MKIKKPTSPEIRQAMHRCCHRSVIPKEAVNDIRALNNVQQSTPTNAQLPDFSLDGVETNPKDNIAGSGWIYDSNRTWENWVKDVFTPGHDDPNNRAKWIENHRVG